MYDEPEISLLLGKTITEINGDEKSDELTFHTDDGKSYRMFYEPDCCASCSIEEIHGELKDLVGSPILRAEERCETPPNEDTRTEDEKDYMSDNYRSGPEDSSTWTFYELATIKGSVTIRWYGSSNGYYSERASFEEVGKSRWDY